MIATGVRQYGKGWLEGRTLCDSMLICDQWPGLQASFCPLHWIEEH